MHQFFDLPAEGPGGKDARTMRASAPATMGPIAVRAARGGMALGKGEERGQQISSKMNY